LNIQILLIGELSVRIIVEGSLGIIVNSKGEKTPLIAIKEVHFVEYHLGKTQIFDFMILVKLQIVNAEEKRLGKCES
jgi:hypothetical protein